MEANCSDGESNWFIVLYCSLLSMLQYGVVRLSGILFVSSMSRFSVDRQRASLPYILCDSIQAFAGPITGFLSLKFGIKRVVTFGCLLSAVGTGTCFFAEYIETVTILWGVVFGLGFSFSCILLPVIITQHFDKNRATAIGITYVGSYVGFAVLPSIVNYLLESYGLSGTFLLLSGILLHGIPLSILLKKPRSLGNTVAVKISTHDVSNVNQSNIKDKSSVNSLELTPRVSSKDSEKNTFDNEIVLSPKFCFHRDILEESSIKHKNGFNGGSIQDKSKFNSEIPEHELSSNYENVSIPKNMSQCNLNYERVNSIIPDVSVLDVKHEADASFSNSKAMPSSFSPNGDRSFGGGKHLKSSGNVSEDAFSISHGRKIFSFWLPQTKFKIDLSSRTHTGDNYNSNISKTLKTFFEPIFIIVSCSSAVYSCTFIAFISIIFDFAKDIGIHVTDGTYVIMAFSIASNIGLVCFGWVTDYGYMSLTNFTGLICMCRTVTLFLIPYSTGITMLVTIASLQGLCEASLANLHPLIIAEHLPKDVHEVAISSFGFLSGPAYLATPALIGYFRDGLGSYYYLFILMSLTSFVCSILHFMAPPLLKCGCRRDGKILGTRPSD